MAGTRRSTRNANNASSSPVVDNTSPKAGTKRKAHSPSKDKSKKKVQKTIEETLPDAEDAPADAEIEDAPTKAETTGDAHTTTKTSSVKPSADDEAQDEPEKLSEDAEAAKDGAQQSSGAKAAPTEEEQPEPEAEDVKMDDTVESGTSKSRDNKDEATKVADATKEDTAKDDAAKDDAAKDDATTIEATKDETIETDKSKSNTSASNGTTDELVEDSKARDDEVPSNIIEKGIIYFFTRGRVGIEEPESVQDLQRTYFVMRPIPTGAKLGEGAIDDTKQNRLMALPKKVFPKSGQDKFMAFVEKGKASMDELKEEFFQGSDYETKTLGTRHTPSITPIGEGVYAITEVGRTTHLVYMLTIPQEPGAVQEEMGICEKGSFVLSLKNPTAKGPANAQLPQGPDFPQEILDDFNGLSWMPVHKSEYLDYPNAQVLLIGEGIDKFGAAVESTDKDKKDNAKETPQEEIEKLEAEDEIRVEALHGEDAVFKDLHISKNDYPKVITTW